MSQPETTLSEEDQKEFLKGKINMAQIKQLYESYVSQGVAQIGSFSKEELDYIAKQNSAQTDMFENFAKIVGEDSCGEYKNYDSIEVTEQEDGMSIDATAMLHFSKRDLKMIMHITVFDNLGPVPTSVEFSLPDSGEEGIGAKMASAGANTLMGMGTVFAVLIFISLLISCFKLIPKITEARERKKAGKAEHAAVKDTKTEEVVDAGAENLTDDYELIAVIAAAIAASENTSTDNFVVRSIRRR
ncbi:MAG: OadG family protein [Eubacterium sp.]|nr:OadG family protein [Eubacterium sp.]